MLTYKDLQLGQCWAFADAGECPGPSIMVPDGAGRPRDLPTNWTDDNPAPDYRWKDRPVELLEHYSTHPRPTPLGKGRRQVYKVVAAENVRAGQWYLGIWTLDTAREVCQDINEERAKPEQYRNDVGPITDSGYVVVHAIDHDDRLGALAHLRARKTQGLTGEACLARFELGMREERVYRFDGKLYVRATDSKPGLTDLQVEAAQELWRATLAHKRAEVADKERLRVLVDLDEP